MQASLSDLSFHKAIGRIATVVVLIVIIAVAGSAAYFVSTFSTTTTFGSSRSSSSSSSSTQMIDTSKSASSSSSSLTSSSFVTATSRSNNSSATNGCTYGAIDIGQHPNAAALAYDPDNGYLYASTLTGLAVISPATNRVVNNVTLGFTPLFDQRR